MPPHLSFSNERSKNANAIAIVRGGDFDGQILYVHNDMSASHLPDYVEINAEDYPLTHLKPKQRDAMRGRMNRALSKNEDMEGLDPKSRESFMKARTQKKLATSITLPADSMFEIVPNPDPKVRSIFYIAGASGSGKSYLARTIAQNYAKLFPEHQIYLVSKLDEDPVLDNLKTGKPKRIRVESLVEEPVENIKEFSDSLILFDDVDTFMGKEQKAVRQLIDDIAAMGRHFQISMAIMTHKISDYSRTRLIINEATHYVLYPQSTSFHNLKYLLTTHMGLEQNQIRDLKKVGRWVCFHKNTPNWMLSEHSAKLLHVE